MIRDKHTKKNKAAKNNNTLKKSFTYSMGEMNFIHGLAPPMRARARRIMYNARCKNTMANIQKANIMQREKFV